MQSTDDKTHRKPPDAVSERRCQILWLATGGLGLAWARTVPARDGPLRLACDPDLVACGLVGALLRAFGRDTGLAVLPVVLGVAAALDDTQAGRCDAVLSASPERATPLTDQGLLHSPRTVARLRWVLVGPLPLGASGERTGIPTAASDSARPAPPRPATAPTARTARTVPASTDAVGSLQALAAEDDSRRRFLVPGADTATRGLAEALWREAGLPALPPWCEERSEPPALIDSARERSAGALVGAWDWARTLASGASAPGSRAGVDRSGLATAATTGDPWGLLADHDPRLSRPVVVLRSFRSQHPAGRLFSDWVAGPAGRRALQRLPGVLPGPA